MFLYSSKVGVYMDKKMLGSLINYERGKKKISLQALAEGISSQSALQRLESGERLLDFFVIERILERLGRSVSKIEFLYDESTYDIYYLRALIEHLVGAENYEEAEDALVYYESLAESKGTLHKQYIYKIKAVIARERDNNHQVALELFEKSLEETVPNFSFKDMDNRILGEEELTILLLWLQEKMEIDALSINLDDHRILSYIERFCEDEEVQINIYSKATWLIGTFFIKRDNYQSALLYTLQGQNVLAENAVLVHMPQFLDRILFLTEGHDSLAFEDWKRQRDALKALYEEFGEVWDTNDIQLWKNYRQQEVYLISELFGQERRLRNQSQEKLADALEMDQKTISRIESGKYKPKTGTLQKMREYLEIDRDVCSTRLVVGDFRLLEMQRDIAKLNSIRNKEAAEKLYKELKKNLPLRWRENQQYVKFMDTMFDRELNRIGSEEALQRCKEAFNITKTDLHIDNVDQVVLNRYETVILNYIATCYKKLNRRNEAIKLLERVMRGYEKSKVDMKFHYAAVALVTFNLAGLYEEVDRFKEAKELYDHIIKFDLKCKRGINIGYAYAEKRYTLDREENNNVASKNAYQQAFQIIKLMKRDNQMKSLQSAYQGWYGEKLSE